MLWVLLGNAAAVLAEEFAVARRVAADVPRLVVGAETVLVAGAQVAPRDAPVRGSKNLFFFQRFHTVLPWKQFTAIVQTSYHRVGN